MRSMTGYGQGVASSSALQVSAELRSVNHRYLDLVFRLPREFYSLENELRRRFQERFSRGRVEIYIQLTHIAEASTQLEFDRNLAIRYHEVLKDMTEQLQLDSHPTAEFIAGLPGVLQLSEQPVMTESTQDLVFAAVDEALDQLVEMSTKEAARLQEDLLQRVEKCRQIWHEIRQRAPGVVEEYRDKLKARIGELIANQQEWTNALAEGRLESEIAYFADKSDIHEELVRLESHLQQLTNLWNIADTPIGRTADFLLQEANREINTIGAKANDAQIAHQVVRFKTELEKMREQVQNIE